MALPAVKQSTKRKRSPVRISKVADSMVTVTVRAGRIFLLHKSLLAKCSEFFRTALEGESTKLDLPDCLGSVFGLFVDWLYSGKLPKEGFEYGPPTVIEYSDELGTEDGEDEEMNKEGGVKVEAAEDTEPVEDEKKPVDHFHNYTTMLMDMYIVADNYDIPKLRRNLMDTLFAHINKDTGFYVSPDYDIITSVWKRLPEKSLLRRFLIDLECRYGYLEHNDTDNEPYTDEESFQNQVKNCSELPREFIVGVMARHSVVWGQIYAKQRAVNYRLNLCDYHEHTDKERRKCVSVSVVKTYVKEVERRPGGGYTETCYWTTKQD